MSTLPKHDAPAQDWIDAGLALPTAKVTRASFRDLSFLEAQANQLLYLTGEGALTLDRVAKWKPPPSPH